MTSFATKPRRIEPGEPPPSAPQLTPKTEGRNRKFEPSPWIGCPACGTVTLEAHPGGAVIRLLDTASGYHDGARCARHSRTLEQRENESMRALNIALYRLGPYLPERGGFIAIDDTAQGTE